MQALQHCTAVCACVRGASIAEQSCAALQETAETEHQTSVVQTEKIINMVEVQRRSMKMRAKKFEDLKLAVTSVVDDEFKKKLKSGRNWKGKVEVDWDSQQCKLLVVANKGAHLHAASQRTLLRVRAGKSRFCVAFWLL
jgi:long-subunit acyl-CoA synthetase (AMP-forming)